MSQAPQSFILFPFFSTFVMCVTLCDYVIYYNTILHSEWILFHSPLFCPPLFSSFLLLSPLLSSIPPLLSSIFFYSILLSSLLLSSNLLSSLLFYSILLYSPLISSPHFSSIWLSIPSELEVIVTPRKLFLHLMFSL